MYLSENRKFLRMLYCVLCIVLYCIVLCKNYLNCTTNCYSTEYSLLQYSTAVSLTNYGTGTPRVTLDTVRGGYLFQQRLLFIELCIERVYNNRYMI